MNNLAGFLNYYSKNDNLQYVYLSFFMGKITIIIHDFYSLKLQSNFSKMTIIICNYVGIG